MIFHPLSQARFSLLSARVRPMPFFWPIPRHQYFGTVPILNYYWVIPLAILSHTDPPESITNSRHTWAWNLSIWQHVARLSKTADSVAPSDGTWTWDTLCMRTEVLEPLRRYHRLRRYPLPRQSLAAAWNPSYRHNSASNHKCSYWAQNPRYNRETNSLYEWNSENSLTTANATSVTIRSAKCSVMTTSPLVYPYRRQ